MLERLRQLIRDTSSPRQQAPDPAERLQLAVAALLVEIARADHEDHPAEGGTITTLLSRHFSMDEAATRELVQQAREAVEASVSLRDFTSPLHRELSYAEKQAVIRMLWQVALGDRDLDKYEEYLVGKLADLLYVTRGDVIRLRHEASLAVDS